MFDHSPYIEKHPNINTRGQAMKEICEMFSGLTKSQKVQLTTCLFNQSLVEDIPVSFIPPDFIQNAVSAMVNLSKNGKYNILYNLAKCLAVGEGGKSRLPLDRMPYGLLSHNIMFFACDDATGLRVEDHYADWLTTMFTHFGHKWVALYNGPMWSTQPMTANDGASDELPGDYTSKCDELSTATRSLPHETPYTSNIIEQAFNETVGSFKSFLEGQSSICGTEDSFMEGESSLSCEVQCNYVSTLWSGLKHHDAVDLQMGEMTSAGLADMFGISKCKKSQEKTLKKNPMKVLYSKQQLGSSSHTRQFFFAQQRP